MLFNYLKQIFLLNKQLLKKYKVRKRPASTGTAQQSRILLNDGCRFKKSTSLF